MEGLRRRGGAGREDRREVGGRGGAALALPIPLNTHHTHHGDAVRGGEGGTLKHSGYISNPQTRHEGTHDHRVHANWPTAVKGHELHLEGI